MRNRVEGFVAAIVILALSAVSWLFLQPISISYSQFWGAALFAALGGLATLFRYQFSKQAFGSIAFLPFLVAVTLAPEWFAAVLVGVATVVGETSQSRANIKRLFNTSQYVLATAASIVAYRALGGVSLIVDETFRIVPLTGAVVCFLLVNSASVAGVVSLSERRRFAVVWKTNTQKQIAFDLLTIPVVYCCALAFTHFGFVGFAVVAINLLGARQFFSTNRRLEQMNEELLEVMVASIEARDPYDSGHSIRVRRIARIIATAIGMPARQIERIGIAALLHDVGKIDQIFHPILQKPGKLSPRERAIMELHPIRSAELVSHVTQLADVVPAIRHHHENYDGTGYPDGLVGEEIPIGSRIIMFADTIDAMTTNRPYRNALGHETVRAELLKYRGSQFDPAICDALLASSHYARIFDHRDSGRLRTVTQVFDRMRKPKTPIAVS